ncbi:MAG: GNAT family N-acetyltransferase [Bacteroidetes bacterium]|nr:GNAT family N-acetyltransferase [Bacteroidota bacterium]
MHKVEIANTKTEINNIIQLRYKVLREPWNQPIESVTDNIEMDSINAFIQKNDTIVACGRLQENENKIGQIRFMAVDELYRGERLGQQILNTLEIEAKKLLITKIELQARENAVNFYKRNGYEIVEKSFLLWGKIQHFLMHKKL